MMAASPKDLPPHGSVSRHVAVTPQTSIMKTIVSRVLVRGPWRWACALWLSLAVVHAGGGPRVYKVLPHFLDQEGRHTLSPSLYERDAYQARLRAQTNLISAIRFDVHWRAGTLPATSLKLRLELRTARARDGSPLILEEPLTGVRHRSGWSHLILSGDAWRRAGSVVAWRACLVADSGEVAELKSFLW